MSRSGFYEVTAPQFPLTSLADDVARLRQVLAWLDGPAVVAGHSYGGQIMTALGSNTGNVVTQPQERPRKQELRSTPQPDRVARERRRGVLFR